MNHKKTLVILTPGFPCDESDTTCLPMQQQMVKALQAYNTDLTIIILSFQYPYQKREYSWHGIRVIAFNGKNKGGIQRLLLRKRVLRKMQTIHAEIRITALLSFWYGECAATANIFAVKHGLQHRCWILGQDARAANKYPRRVKLGAGEMIAISDAIASAFTKNHGATPAHTIPPGIDTTLFNTTREERNIDILAAGSLIPLKQYDILIEVVASVKKKIPGIKAEIIGKGPEKQKLAGMIEKFSLQQNVSLAGELPYPEVLRKMQHARLLIHPSSYEGFSGACMEALYAGAHVISFCKPMKGPIDHWHIVNSKEEMVELTANLLQLPLADFTNVLYNRIEDAAANMMQLLFQRK